ncbi:MAG TPA: AbrB/MazE/SpoVT family DNA-binding domain-containing protein [Chloroflexia bacterium]|nr:AbrB/MazE/SpoVT family DNA-binding domain-containing protein [Chloroflexia bacterium]
MKEITAILSSNGRVTIPAEIRKHLSIKEGDKLSFVIEGDGSVRIEFCRYGNLNSLKGAAGSLEKPLRWEEMIRIARDDHFAS